MSYLNRVKASKEERVFRTPEGDYEARFDGWKWGPSKKSGKNQFTLNFKPVKAPSQEALDKLTAKDRKLTIYANPTVDFMLDNLLEFLHDVGMDISTCDENDVTEWKDIKALLTQLESGVRPVCKLHVKWATTGTNNNVYFNGLADGQAPVSSGVPTPPVPQAFTYEQMIANNWTDEMLLGNPMYAHLVPKPVAPTPAPEMPVSPPMPSGVPEPTFEQQEMPLPAPAPAPVAPTPAPVAPAPAPAPVAPVAPEAPKPPVAPVSPA